MDQFRNIGVIGRMGSVKVVETLRSLKTYLLSENYQVILEYREHAAGPCR